MQQSNAKEYKLLVNRIGHALTPANIGFRLPRARALRFGALICFALHCVAVLHCFALRYLALLFCFALLCFALPGGTRFDLL